MGLLDMLTNQGSSLTAYNGTQPPTNPLATQQSKLHVDGNQPGYSLNGANATLVTTQYNGYQDGTPNQIPFPSLLDLNGTTPPPYLDNLPQ
jgi:hypothetical protein